MQNTPVRRRLLAAPIVLALGLAFAPAVMAQAAPPAAGHVAAATETDVAALTERERVLDSSSRLVTDGGRADADRSEPPTWLLVLLAPILLGGVIAAGLTVRRLA